MEKQQHVQVFGVKQELLEVLKTVGAKGEAFTFNEIITYLRKYFNERVLFDLKEPNVIRCENDLLGKVFGVKTFTLADIPKFLFSKYLLSPSNSEPSKRIETGHLADLCGPLGPEKRKCDQESSDADIKKQRAEHSEGASCRGFLSWMFTFGPTPDYDSGSESVLSVQGYETAFAKDSSDDTWYYETEAEFEVDLSEVEMEEYEVNSISSGICDSLSDTESELDDVMSAEIWICKNDSDREFWADSSSNEQHCSTDSDPEITDGDKWKCQHCMALNKPLLRFCQKCWQLRNGWLPECKRPKRHRRKKLRKLRRVLSAPEGRIERSPNPVRRTSRSITDLMADSELQIHSPLTSRSEGDPCGSQESLPSTSGISESTMCSICLTKPKNASIVHGRTGHVISCYGCGLKLWEQKGTCPVCRRTIQKVIQNFVV